MQLIKKLVVRIATPQRYLGTFVENIKDRVTFNSVYFSFQIPHFVVDCHYNNFDAQSHFSKNIFQNVFKIFPSIITSENLNFSLKLCLLHVVKIFKYLFCLIFFL